MTPKWHLLTATELGEQIRNRSISPLELTQHFLTRIKEQDSDRRIYVRTTDERALVEAEAAEIRAAQGLARSPLDGVPISWKDLYDTAGVRTEGGSPLLAERTPKSDATVLERATSAGMICLGKTNTVQFALGGIGTNPVTGTPPNAVMTDTPRAPGGSSSGAAVSVASGLAAAGIGSDTGGSVRVPAAWNALVGFKTSIGALPMRGVLPLARSLDTVGPLTKSVTDAAALFAILGARPLVDLNNASPSKLKLLVAETVVWDDIESGVENPLRTALEKLIGAGAKIDYAQIPEFAEITTAVKRHGSIAVAEGYQCWKHLIDEQGQLIDPLVRFRFHQGRDMSTTNIESVRSTIIRLTPTFYQRIAGYDALLAPTVPIQPPPLSEVETNAEKYRIANGLALRNTQIGNLLPSCAITLPVTSHPVPAGLMVITRAGDDDRLLRVAKAIENTVSFNHQQA